METQGRGNAHQTKPPHRDLEGTWDRVGPDVAITYTVRPCAGQSRMPQQVLNKDNIKVVGMASKATCIPIRTHP